MTLKLVDPKDKHNLLVLDYELLNILEFNNDRKRMSVSQPAMSCIDVIGVLTREALKSVVGHYPAACPQTADAPNSTKSILISSYTYVRTYM